MQDAILSSDERERRDLQTGCHFNIVGYADEGGEAVLNRYIIRGGEEEGSALSLELRSRDRFVSELVGFSSADRLWVHAFLSPTRRADSSGRRPSLLPFAPSPSLSQLIFNQLFLFTVFRTVVT